ncbi:MAG: sulfotransferase family protein [Candidatus Xenobia bacterium]
MSLQAELTEIWKDVLGVRSVGPHDDFRKLGGTARHAWKLAARLKAKLNDVVYPQMVLMAATIVEQVRFVRKFYLQTPPEFPKEPTEVAKWRQFLGQAYHGQAAVPLGPPNPPSVFILSPIRGGSTLLRVMLAGHASLFAPPELDLLTFTCMQQRMAGLKDGWYDYQGLERALMELQQCDVAAARQQVAQMVADNLPCQEVYRRLQAAAAPRMLVDKSTAYGVDRQVLARAEAWFAAPRYVHLTRHPLATVRSFLQAKMWQSVNFGPNPRHTPEMIWLVSHEHFLEFLRGVPEERQIRITFETLVATPQEELQRLCRFLDVAYDPVMAEPYQGERMTDGIDGFVAGDPLFEKRRQVEAEAAGGSRRWPEDGPLAAETVALAQQLGYQSL